MTDAAPVREFFCVEFNHPTRGWTLLIDVYPYRNYEGAQASIVRRVSMLQKTRRDEGSRAYRVVRYVPEVTPQ